MQDVGGQDVLAPVNEGFQRLHGGGYRGLEDIVAGGVVSLVGSDAEGEVFAGGHFAVGEVVEGSARGGDGQVDFVEGL